MAGPLDIVGAQGRGPDSDFPATIGVLDEDLGRAIRKALRLDPLAAAIFGARHSWDRATDQFLAALETAVSPAPAEDPQTAVPA